jgi:hypothetical protein
MPAETQADPRPADYAAKVAQGLQLHYVMKRGKKVPVWTKPVSVEELRERVEKRMADELAAAEQAEQEAEQEAEAGGA